MSDDEDMSVGRKRLGGLIGEILEDDDNRKRAKRANKEKAVRFNEDDNVEYTIEKDDAKDEAVNEGPIKEDMVELAWQKRQLMRDGQDEARLHGFDLKEGEDAEEEQEYENLDGNATTGFNMKDEESEGWDAATGEFRRTKKEKEEEELAKDGWLSFLDSKEGKDKAFVSDAVKRRLEENWRRAAEEHELGERDVAEAKRVLIGYMEPRETVMAALKRISARPKAAAKPQHRVGRQAATPEERQRKQRIEAFTEAADLLMGVETDIYEQRREELQHACSLSLALDTPGAGTSGTGAQADDDADDLFASSDDEAAGDRAAAGGSASTEGAPSSAEAHAKGSVREASHEASAEAGAASAVNARAVAGGSAESAETAAAPTAPAAQPAPTVDYSSWPVSELKRVLTEANVDVSSVTEKAELIQKAEDLDRSRLGPAVPAGFVLDPASGYYFCTEWNLYYDATSGCYFKDGQWLTYDPATGEYTAVQ